MRLFCLHEGSSAEVAERVSHLSNAATVLGVEIVLLNSLTVDYSNLPVLSKGDMLYNVGRGSQVLESCLINDDVTTFYRTTPALNQTASTTGWSILRDKHGLPTPRTIHFGSNDRLLLKRYVDFLGGFPLVLKTVGSTRGIGTMKLDTWHGLVSVADFLVSTGTHFIMRQYVVPTSLHRLIVIGDEVIASAECQINEGDFRNAAMASQVKYAPVSPSLEEMQAAIRATHIANTYFGGVDIIIDDHGHPFILEVNFPTGFCGLVPVCNVDIAMRMVEFLYRRMEQR